MIVRQLNGLRKSAHLAARSGDKLDQVELRRFRASGDQCRPRRYIPKSADVERRDLARRSPTCKPTDGIARSRRAARYSAVSIEHLAPLRV